MGALRPFTAFMAEATTRQVLARACDLLSGTGVRIDNAAALGMLADHGARIDPRMRIARFGHDLIDRARRSLPPTVDLYDESGATALTLGGGRVACMPGSTAPFVLDLDSGRQRKAASPDLIALLRLVNALPGIQLNNPALVMADVPQELGDTLRYCLALSYSAKPVAGGGVTSAAAMDVIHDMRPPDPRATTWRPTTPCSGCAASTASPRSACTARPAKTSTTADHETPRRWRRPWRATSWPPRWNPRCLRR